YAPNRSSEDSLFPKRTGSGTDRESILPPKPRSSYKKDVFEFVMVCSGHHWRPRVPDFPGMDEFTGQMIHSSQYKVPYPYKDDKVLVVGVGNSGIDISSEISTHASKVLLSSRSGTWITPRTTLFGLPTDHLSTRAAHSVPRFVLNYAMETLLTLHHGDMEKYNLKPKHTFLEANPVVGTNILQHIDSGKITVKPNVARFTASSVEFVDGTTQDIDSVIFCTGYLIENPFIDPAIMGKEEMDSNRVRLYKHMFSTTHANMAFIGLVQPNGSILPVAELQSRWAAQVFAGKSKLPSLRDMRDQADLDWQAHLKVYLPRERMTVAVDQVEYMDLLAEQVGCKPDLWKLWKTNWSLALRVTFGPCVSAHYRLMGDHSWDGAEKVIAQACVDIDFRKLLNSFYDTATGKNTLPKK
ncbi:Cyclopentanone 1,2-monooxygenase (CPMO), partial [Kappamyces sp. JEL0680]